MLVITENDALAGIIEAEIKQIQREKESDAKREELRREEMERRNRHRKIALTTMLVDLNALLQKALASSDRLRQIMEEKFPCAVISVTGRGPMLTLWKRGLSEPRSISLCVERKPVGNSFEILLCWEPFTPRDIRTDLLGRDFDQIPENFYAFFRQYSDEIALTKAIVRKLHHA